MAVTVEKVRQLPLNITLFLKENKEGAKKMGKIKTLWRAGAKLSLEH